jgi:hypothetical protein
VASGSSTSGARSGSASRWRPSRRPRTSPCFARGDFDVASDAQCSFIVEPDYDIQKSSRSGSPTTTTAATRTRSRRSLLKQARA